MSLRSLAAALAVFAGCCAASVHARAQSTAANGAEAKVTAAAVRAEERTVGDAGSDPCAAALAGRGGYMKVWTDAANGVRIMLTLLPGAEGPMLTYTTPEADAWERRKTDARF